MGNITRTFGAHLTVARERAGMTQQQLAERAGLGQTALVSRYERGMSVPTLENAARLARALGVTIDSLVGGEVRDAG